MTVETMTGTAAGRARDLPAAGWKRIGMIVPSSNTVLEPVTGAMLADLGGAATAHFARLPVTEISLSERSRSQFTPARAVEAATALAEARPDVIAWNGTSASWLGIETDEALATAVADATGVPATTTTLAYHEAFAALGVRRLGVVTPYLSEIQERILAEYARHGIEVVADRRLEDPGNFSFAEYSPALVGDLVREAAAARPDAVAIVCTNFRGQEEAAAIEREAGVTVLDSVAVTLWGALRHAGLDPAPLARHGRLFACR